jgi:T-complex protein 1 subunit gamma
VDGIEGGIIDMKVSGVVDPLSVKTQTLKTAVESACMLLRIDDIVSGMVDRNKEGPSGAVDDDAENETFGDARDG